MTACRRGLFAAISILGTGFAGQALADELASHLQRLPTFNEQAAASVKEDWLVVPVAQKAAVYRSGPAEVTVTNGLVRRTWRVTPNGATVSFNNLMTGEQLLRSVRPEAIVELDGVKYPVGGLTGQPIHNYLDPRWIEKMTSERNAFMLVGLETGKTQARFPWKKRLEWMPQDLPWPPPGVSLTLHFCAPQSAAKSKSASVTVDVHYEPFDGIPLLSKWITVRNGGDKPVRLVSFTA